MSFLIDDILKKDEPEICYTSEKKERASVENDSILQKTLLNRQFQYYRSISEPNGNNMNWCPNDRMYPEYYDIYKTKAMSYPNIYARTPTTPLWSHYSTNPFAFFPQFCHLSKRKGGQVRFTANQTDALEKRFASHKYLSPEDRKLLADSLKLTDRQVKTWFQNRRAKWRRCNSVSSTEISSTRFEENKINNLYKKSD